MLNLQQLEILIQMLLPTHSFFHTRVLSGKLTF
jgi:hypothetical protein